MLETVMSFMAAYVAPAVLVALAALGAIAPLTRSEWDNKALAVLRWIEQNVLRLLLPGRPEARKPPVVLSTNGKTPGPGKRDHRTDILP